jgi:hypothetical protein
VLVVLWRYRYHHPWLTAAVAVFVLSLAPVVGVIPFGSMLGSTTSDRFVYGALVAPAMALAWLLARWRRGVLWGLVVVALGALALRSADG